MILNIFYAWLKRRKTNLGGNVNTQKERNVKFSDQPTKTYTAASIKYHLSNISQYHFTYKILI